MNRLPRLIALTAAFAALTACGNKGPLVLPTAPAPEALEAPPGEVPVELAPEAAVAPDPDTNPSSDALDETQGDPASDTPPAGADPAEPPQPVPGHG